MVIPYHKLPETEELADLYFNEELSTAFLAEKFGSSKTAVRAKLTRNGYELRNCSEGQNLVANHIDLTEELLEDLNGFILGDGSIVSTPDYGKSACYKHADKHHHYLIWLKQKLQHEYNIESKITLNEDNPACPCLCTKYYREFIILRRKWYPNGKKIIPDDLCLLPNTLKNWYIGDGNFWQKNKNTAKGEKLTIASQFDQKPSHRQLIITQLTKQGIKVSDYGHIFYIRAKSRRQFFNYILSKDTEIPTGYEYKFPEKYLEVLNV